MPSSPRLACLVSGYLATSSLTSKFKLHSVHLKNKFMEPDLWSFQFQLKFNIIQVHLSSQDPIIDL